MTDLSDDLEVHLNMLLSSVLEGRVEVRRGDRRSEESLLPAAFA